MTADYLGISAHFFSRRDHQRHTVTRGYHHRTLHITAHCWTKWRPFVWGHYRVGNTRETRSTQSLLTAEVTWLKPFGIGCEPFRGTMRKRKRRNSQMILKQAQLHFHYIKASAVFPASSSWLCVNSIQLHHQSVHCSQHPVWQRSFKSESQTQSIAMTTTWTIYT